MSMTIALPSWRDQRLGLSMITASLVVIGIIVVLLLSHFYQQKLTKVREQGVSLTRVLSGIPYEQLVAKPGKRGILSVLRLRHGNPDFAYAALVTPQGRPVAQVSAPGTVIPSLQFSSGPTASLDETEVVLQDRRKVLEFDAPLYTEGVLSGYVRVGYFRPGFGLSKDQLTFFGSLALPVFLLTPLFFLLVKREIRPLRKVNQGIEALVAKQGLQNPEVSAGGELSQLMDRFNQFVDYSQKRISTLESDHAGLLTSTKLLSYKRARVESVIQSFPDAVLVLDETGTITVANSRVSTLLGRDPKQLVGTKPRDWCSDEDVLAMLANHESKTMGGVSSATVQFSPEHSPEKTVEAGTHPLFSQTDPSQMLGTLVVFRDITWERLAMQSRGEFVAHVAHELKSPLNVLAMYSEALQGEDGRSETFRIEAANVIHDEVERLSSLIGNILSITKIEMGSLSIERQRVKIREFLQDAFDTVCRGARDKDLQLEFDAPKEMGAVFADKALLSIAISNLLTNAIKYNRPDGNVMLTAGEEDEAITVSVRDSGIGIAPEDQKKIFDKFFRSNADEVRQRSGHGLGLALAREIIQLHHGTLNVNSRLGEGTEFVIELPKQSFRTQQDL